MNYLQKKKLAFMSIVNRVKGFIRTITGALPLTLEGCVDEKSITYYKLYGQSVQNGTPTPEMPVEVESVGEKTRNIWYPSVDTVTQNGITATRNSDNTFTVNGTATDVVYLHLGTVSVEIGTVHYLSGGTPNASLAFQFRQGSSGLGTVVNSGGVSVEDSYLLIDSDTINVVIKVTSGATVNEVVKPMISLENTDEYEPYGYKIPIKVSGNGETITTNIYLDEPLRKVGDYADYIKSVDLVNGTGVVVRRVTKVLNALPKVNIITQKKPNTIMVGCHGMFCKGNTLIYSPIFKNGRPELVWGNDSELIMSHIAENTNDFAYFKLKYDRLNLALGDDRTTVYNVDDESKTALTNSQIFATINDYLTLNFTEEELSIYVCDYRSPTETPITLPPIPTFKGTNIISTDTTIQPSNAEVTYYSNVKE